MRICLNYCCLHLLALYPRFRLSHLYSQAFQRSLKMFGPVSRVYLIEFLATLLRFKFEYVSTTKSQSLWTSSYSYGLPPWAPMSLSSRLSSQSATSTTVLSHLILLSAASGHSQSLSFLYSSGCESWRLFATFRFFFQTLVSSPLLALPLWFSFARSL